jgi:hypothetical protein
MKEGYVIRDQALPDFLTLTVVELVDLSADRQEWIARVRKRLAPYFLTASLSKCTKILM